MSFWVELKRRKVVQVAAVYAVVAWLLIQIVATVEEPLGLPVWVDTLVIVLLAIGFPAALILSWAFDLTSKGIETTRSSVAATTSRQAAPATTFTYVIQGLVLLAVAFLIADQYLLGEAQSRGQDASTRPVTVTRFFNDLPQSQFFRDFGRPGLAVSPDGESIFYTVDDGLYVRAMNSLEPRLVLGTDRGMHTPFSSPDGNEIGYWDSATTEIKRIATAGGAPVTVARGIIRLFGASWAADGSILFATEDGVYRAPPHGDGSADLLFETAEGQQAYGPQLLPDGDSVLFSVATPGDWDRGEVVVQSMESGERRVLLSGGTSVRYLQTGHLIYAIDEDLYAVPFDSDSITVTGQPVRVLQGVMRGRALWQTGVAQYDVSDNGTLTYITREQVRDREVIWVNRSGGERRLPLEPRAWSSPRVSPDGERILLNEGNVANDIWVFNIRNETPTRLSLGSAGGDSPAWSSDGTRIAYHPSYGAFVDWRAANNAGIPERLANGGPDALDPFHPEVFSPSGEHLVILGRSSTATGWDIGLLTVDGSVAPRWLLTNAADESAPSISPNGRWLAYQSNESGRYEVYVRPFPNVNDSQIPVSNRGGIDPLWSRDGSELLYIEPAIPPRMMSVAVDTTSAEFGFGERSALMDWPYRITPLSREYDVSADGAELVTIKPLGDELDRPRIIVVQNWFEELELLAPIE